MHLWSSYRGYRALPPALPQFNALRHHLLGQVLDFGIDVARMSSKDFCNLLLYGKPNGSTFVNRIILEATISFMKSSKQFTKNYGVTTAKLQLVLFCVVFLFFFFTPEWSPCKCTRYIWFTIYIIIYFSILITSVLKNASFSIKLTSHSSLLHSRCEACMDSTLGNIGVIKEKLQVASAVRTRRLCVFSCCRCYNKMLS